MAVTAKFSKTPAEGGIQYKDYNLKGIPPITSVLMLLKCSASEVPKEKMHLEWSKSLTHGQLG